MNKLVATRPGTMRAAAAGILLALALAGCGGAPERDDAGGDNVAAAVEATPAPTSGPAPASTTATAQPPASAAPPAGPRECSAEIGRDAADRLVRQCIAVSPATRPPCNVRNSCAMIRDEIARSCALLDAAPARDAGCAPLPGSVEAAADVVERYYAALDARDFSTAWQQWGADGQPGQTYRSFEQGFARTRETRAQVARPSRTEGAAGSLYVTVPVRVDAVLDDGTRQRFTGSYVVRRVNDVDGASADQLRWHLDSAMLRPAA